MAKKRMFDKAVIDTDRFMDLPISAKALYFLLGMEADDEGFVSYKKVQRIHGGTDDDIRVLDAKNFVIRFESGVVVITDWKKNNYLDKNRITETEYTLEKEMLGLDKGKYILLNKCLTSVKPVENSRVEKSREEKSIAAPEVAAPSNEQTKEDFIQKCRENKRRDINIIGAWAELTGVSFSKKDQWNLYVRRNVRAAKELSTFDDEQIQQAFSKVEEDKKNGLKYQPALETLLKKLTK